MQTMKAEFRHRSGPVLAPVMVLFLLSILAVPAEAQRGRGGHAGRGGSGHHGQSYGSSHGHRGGGYGRGGNRIGGYGSHGYGHRGYGRSGGHGNGSYHGYRYRGYSGHRGYARNYSYRGHRGYTGYQGYPSYYGSYRYRPYGAGAYYRGPGSWGFGYYGYPGVSIHYDASPRTILYEPGVDAPRPGYRGYVPSIALPETAVTENGEPYEAATEAFDARQEPARVKLVIEPGDASVYLDDRFLGLASELPDELWIDPGAHRLAVARPGYASRALDLDLGPGEELEIDSRLSVQ